MAAVSSPDLLVYSPTVSFSPQADSPPPKKQRCGEDPEDDFSADSSYSFSDPEDDVCHPDPPYEISDYCDPPPTKAELDEYEAAVRASDGFDVPFFQSIAARGGLFPAKFIHSYTDGAEEAIKHFNNKTGKRFKVVRIVRITQRHCVGALNNMTFEAKNLDNDSTETFRAIMLYGSMYGPTMYEVLYCDRYPGKIFLYNPEYAYLDKVFPSWMIWFDKPSSGDPFTEFQKRYFHRYIV